MPNSPSSKKRLRQSEKSRLRNRGVKSALRGQIRKLRETVDAGNVSVAKTELVVSVRALDVASAKGVIHRNKASRTKSRLNRLVKKAAQATK